MELFANTDFWQSVFNVCIAAFAIATVYGDRLTAKRLKELEDESRKTRRSANNGGDGLDS